MTTFTIIFVLLNVAALLCLPRRLATLPLLVGSCYMTVGPHFDIGPITVTVIRFLIAVGFVRVVLRSEQIAGGVNSIDKLMGGWMAWIIFSSLLHQGKELPFTFNLGQAYNIGGIYFLIRVFCKDVEEFVGVLKFGALLLAPIALEMISEQLTGKNRFSIFGAANSEVIIRGRWFRAQGPFSHPILAGSVGATCFPLMVGIWKRHRVAGIIGMTACMTMVGASASSGPILTLLLGIGAIFLWQRYRLIKFLRWCGIGAYAFLAVVMNRPAYYIISEIDLTGSSAGWHRARLIESAIEHLDEWWLAGTSNTRHWMASGVPWSENHTDITNYYLLMGVWAGLPLMILFIAVFWVSFRYVGQMVRNADAIPDSQPFMIWCIGAALFSHAANCVSVAYYDQSYIFLFSCMAVIASLHGVAVETVNETNSATTEKPHMLAGVQS